ncbi:MAG: sulfur carrier protein ThiS [Candidatus Omnitrophica bacterium]|nr:sulfur carrier protein ThiS [Candidatus Omnitrophota bacterium]
MGIIIYLNGKKEEISKDTNISKLLEIKKIRPEVVTVEVNEKIIEREKYSQVYLKDNDKVEFVYYMGGGIYFIQELTVK